MKKQTFIRRISILLVIALMFSFLFTGCSLQKDSYKSEHTVSVLSTAIRTMSDSAFTELKLVEQIYNNAFTNSAKVNDYLAENLEDTFAKYSNDEPDELLVNATVAYGGSEMNNITIGKLKSSKAIKQNRLYVGDLLFVNVNDVYSFYIYDVDGFVNLSNPLEDVDTKEVLDDLRSSKQFVLIRPMLNMTSHDFVEGNLPELKLTDEQQALIVTAQSFLLRGDKLQYVSFTGLNTKKYIGVTSPEDYTSDNYGPIQCSGFCYTVYKQALGMDIKYGDIALSSTARLSDYSDDAGIQKYYMECKMSSEYTDEDKEKITNEILDLIEPGDILVVRRAGGTGHAMLYIGNENIIHSGGSSYNTGKKTETYEATVRQMRFKDYFCVEGTSGYIFGYDKSGKVTDFCVVRPLDIYDGEIPETTKNRIKNLQGVMAQKTSSHNISLTADIGEEITYTFEIYNQNNKEVSLDVSDVVPEKTEYVSGADKVDGNNLSWHVDIPANTRIKVSYTVKVSSDAQKGDVIISQSGVVGGVPVNCLGIMVNNTLSQTELNTLKNVINNYQAGEKTNGFEIVNDIYKKAFGWDPIFDDTVFKTVYEGENGLYKQGENVIELRDDTKYGMMVAPNLSGGHGTKEAKEEKPVVMPAKEQQLVVGDVLIAKQKTKDYLYIYGGDGKFYNLGDGFKLDSRTAQGRMEYFLCSEYGYVVLRPSLVQ